VTDIRDHLVAHRGDHEHCPENSLPAFERAVTAGAEWLECDVQFGGDLTPVILHDAHLFRLCGVDEYIGNLNADAIQRLRLHEPERPGNTCVDSPVLRLDQFLSWLRQQSGVKLFLEVKPHVLNAVQPDDVMRALAPLFAKKLPGLVMISSSAVMLQALYDEFSCPLGWVAASGIKQPDVPFEYIFVQMDWLSRIKAFHRQGLKVVAYTVDDPGQLAACLNGEADLVETNHFRSLSSLWNGASRMNV